MSVSFGCLFRSALSLISRGSNAILWPLAELSYDVSGPDRSSARFDGTDGVVLPDSSSLVDVAGPPPPRRRVRPDAEDIAESQSKGA